MRHSVLLCARRLFAAALVLMISACSSSDSGSPTTPPPPAAPAQGRVVFWTDQPVLIPMTIEIAGVNAGVISAASPEPPDCGDAGFVTISRTAGMVAFKATTAADPTKSWGPTLEVEGNTCITMRLYSSTPPVPATTGRLSIWQDGSTPGGIAVRVNGVEAGKLTQYFPDAQPQCGQAGTLTVTVGAGAAMLFANWTDGKLQWVAAPTVTANGCTLFGLGVPAAAPPATPPPTGGTGTGLTGADSPDLVWISTSFTGGGSTPVNQKARVSSSMKGSYCQPTSLVMKNTLQGADWVLSIKSSCNLDGYMYVCATSGNATLPYLPTCAQDPFDTPINRLSVAGLRGSATSAAAFGSSSGISVEVFYCSSVTTYRPPANFGKGSCR